MRIPSILLPAVVVAAIGGAFWAGHFIAQRDAEKASRNAVLAVSAQDDAASFAVVSGARAALKEGRPAQANLVLLNYAALKASALIECRKSVECAGWAGAIMPSAAALTEAIAAAGAAEGKDK